MKNLFLVFIVSFIFLQNNNAQFFEKNYLYGNIGITGGNYFGADVGANIIFKKKYYIHAGILSLQSEASEKPKDYTAGSGIFGGGDSDISDSYNIPHITGGYVLKLNSKFRAILNGGLGLQFRDYATDFTIHESTGTFGGFNFGTSPSHDYLRKKDVSLAFIINPRLEYLLSHIYGMAVSPLVIFSENNTFIGIGFNNLIGKIRKRKKSTNEENINPTLQEKI